MENGTFDIEKAIQAQETYCKENHAPHFAPHSGKCFSCGNNIYSAPYGYTVEYAGQKLVTGCPICMASYCD